MQLYKNDIVIREYKFYDAYRRREVLKIWNLEVKPNGVDHYELIIRPADYFNEMISISPSGSISICVINITSIFLN